MTVYNLSEKRVYFIVWNASKYGVFSGPYFPAYEYLSVFSQNAGKCGPEKTPYLDIFHAVLLWKHSKVHSKSSLTSKTEFFAKIFKAFEPLTITRKKLLLRCLDSEYVFDILWQIIIGYICVVLSEFSLIEEFDPSDLIMGNFPS